MAALKKRGRKKGTPKTGGRLKGTPNKLTGALRDMIIEASAVAGGEGGTVAYLSAQARDNPTAYLGLLGKCLPLHAEGEAGTALQINLVRYAGD